MDSKATDMSMSVQRSAVARARMESALNLEFSYVGSADAYVGSANAGVDGYTGTSAAAINLLGSNQAICAGMTEKPWTTWTTGTRFCTHRQRLKENVFV